MAQCGIISIIPKNNRDAQVHLIAECLKYENVIVSSCLFAFMITNNNLHKPSFSHTGICIPQSLLLKVSIFLKSMKHLNVSN